MASEFASLLARFVEVYRNCPDDLKRFLNDEAMWSEYPDHRKKGDRVAEDQLSSRALFELRTEHISDLLNGFEPIQSDELGDDFYRLAFKSANLDEIAKATGLRREEVIAFLIAEVKIKEMEDAEKPDFFCIFALDFASRIDGIIERFSRLDDLAFGAISPTARKLLREAHLCYLYGFETAAIALCGAVLEQMLKERLKHGGDFEVLLKEAEDDSIITPEEWGLGDDVRELRNKALHKFDSKDFYKTLERERVSFLKKTRTIVGSLLSQKQADGAN